MVDHAEYTKDEALRRICGERPDAAQLLGSIAGILGEGPMIDTPERQSGKLSDLDIRNWCPKSFEPLITTPHEHESKGSPPLWLIWIINGAVTFPVLDSVADSEDSCRCHVGMILYSDPDEDVHVERIPANHRFGSSLEDWQMKAYHSVRMFRKRHQLDGD